MTLALKKEQKQFVEQMVHTGRFHNQREVVDEALRRMAEDETDYLVPPPLTPAQVENIYGPNEENDQERRFGRAVFTAVRRAAGRSKCA